MTGPHTLSETFSALTGGGFELVMPDGTRKHRRLSLRAASAVVSRFHLQLEYVEPSANQIVAVLQTARDKEAQEQRKNAEGRITDKGTPEPRTSLREARLLHSASFILRSRVRRAYTRVTPNTGVPRRSNPGEWRD
jgi:hypothetical protein